jgi:adenine-specific DNA-methyltransferase
MTEVQQKFIDLLKEMFQFDQADLDFGIYRIMNAKHDEIEKFLEQDLPNEIDEGLKAITSPTSTEKIKELEEKIKLAIEMDMPKDKIDQLVQQKNALSANSNLGSAENDIYNNLLDFFSRYYDEGDFISQRRYSKGKYAIPYEGEEVKLHWANADQYYIKTSEYFKDYTFSDGFGNKVHFKILDAETEQNNNKSKDKKFFQLTEQEKKFEIIGGELYIYIEYRIGTQKTQKPYIQEIIDSFANYANENANEYQNFISLTVKERGQESSLLEKQLINYTAKNNFDYFIHKDLRGFLTQELDFYIKNEVIRLDDIDETDETKTKLILTKAKVLRTIAKKIIAFLAQLEDFQKKLFLKKKFVTETNYCITLDRIDECFYKEIAANDAQRKEWIKLFAIDEIKESSGDLLTEGKCGYSEPLTEQFLKQNPYLVLDTAFFSAGFKEKLVASIDDFDEKLDGLLIHSENFQALNLLLNKYKEKIDCCYIDPPYNTSASEILYKNNYKNSSWLTLMNDRLRLGKDFLKNDSIQCTTIDDVEQSRLSLLLEQNFGSIPEVVAIRIKPSGRPIPNGFAIAHEYGLFNKKTEKAYIKRLSHSEEQKDRYKESDSKGVFLWELLRKAGSNSFRENRPTMFYPFYLNIKTNKLRIPTLKYNEAKKEFDILEKTTENEIIVYPLKDDGTEGRWYYGLESAQTEINELKAEKQTNGQYYIYRRRRPNEGVQPTTIWTDSKYSATEHGTDVIKGLFGEQDYFSYPKSIYAVEDCLQVCSKEKNAIILDFFAGSGTTAHAVINLNRDDEGNRKYILCEMGNYFDTVTKPRVQKVIYSKDWKVGKPISREGSSHAFKYIRLESYEDTLNNITMKSSDEGLLDSAREDYFLNYMMDFESKESDSLLNIEKLAHPFDYTMKITRAQECKEQKIDLVETFNYLIGLTVTSNGALQGYDATFSTDTSKPLTATIKSGSTYRIKMIEGTNRTGERVLVIWRDLTGDIEKDNAVLDAFFAKKHVNPLDFEYKTIYVNGDNNLQNIKTEDETWKVVLIESEMKKRMFSEN